MCLPIDLAREAGISAAEYRLLKSLQDRRQALDARERDIVTREGVITAAQQRVDERLAALRASEANLTRLLGQVDAAEAARVAGLARIYEKMKPKDAARVLDGMDDAVLVRIAQRMREPSMALILANMSSERARAVTRRLAALDLAESRDLQAPAPAAGGAAPAPNAAPAPANARPKAAQPAKPKAAAPAQPKA